MFDKNNSFDSTSDLLRKSITGKIDILPIISAEKDSLDSRIQQIIMTTTNYSFKKSGYDDVYAFFEDASKDYDSDLVNPYWSFTHEILKHILIKFISEHFQDSSFIRVFDAGAGTGNWSKFVLGLNINIKGIIFDMNSRMLKIAKPKLDQLRNDFKIVQGNLEVSSDFPKQKSNLILCMHNVIGLARNTEVVLQNLYDYLENDGLAFIMAMNKYHAINFNSQFRNDKEILRVVKDRTVKFKNDMPEMFCYTPEEFKIILQKSGFQEVIVLGFPITVYPSRKDTKLLEKDGIDQLKDPKSRIRLLNIEKRLCLYPDLAYRAGSSLIAICKKNVTGG